MGISRSRTEQASRVERFVGPDSGVGASWGRSLAEGCG
jgi:hypothetical protein